jgi:hypothetical protein
MNDSVIVMVLCKRATDSDVFNFFFGYLKKVPRFQLLHLDFKDGLKSEDG